MSGDLTIILNASGNLDAQVAQVVARLQQARNHGREAGKETEGGFQGAIERLHELHKDFAKFIAAGAIGYHLFADAVEIWSKAHERATERAKQKLEELREFAKRVYDAKREGLEEGWKSTTVDLNLRMAGVGDAGQRNKIAGELLENTGPAGEEIRRAFARIAEQVGHQGLKSDETGRLLVRAVESLNRFGHIQGYGENLNAILGMKGMKDREDVGELALGLTLRKARLPEAIGKSIEEAFASGKLTILSDGGLRGKDEAADLAKQLNALGGLLPRGASEGFNPRPTFADALDPLHGRLGGVITGPTAGEAEQFQLPEQFRKAPRKPEEFPQGYGPVVGDATIKDALVAAWQSPLVEQAIATALGLAFLGAFKNALPRLGAAIGAEAATSGVASAGGAAATNGVAGAAAAGAGTTWAARVAAMARTGVGIAARGSVLATPLLISGDATAANSQVVPDDLEREARMAARDPTFRGSLIQQAKPGSYAEQILSRMHDILLAMLHDQRQPAVAVAVSTQAGE